MGTLTTILWSSFNVFLEAAIYLLFGFLIAGIMRVLLKPESVVRYFSHGRVRSVLYASLLGIPIPL